MLKALSQRFFSGKTKLPGILSDIDGVVYRGGREIGNSRKVIDFLLNRTFHGKHIPFALLTNGGGISEDERAKYIAHVIGLDKKNSGKSLEGSDHMLMCHTPFRDTELVKKYADKYVLVSGLGKMIELAQLYGYSKAIDIEELFALYPVISPVTLSCTPQ